MLKHFSRKKTIFIAAAVLATVLVLFIYSRAGKTAGGVYTLNLDAMLADTAAADFYDDSNRLVVGQGSATVTKPGGARVTVTMEAKVVPGDSVEVGKNSSATLYWFDHSISRLQAGTKLTVDKADYNPSNIAETHIDANVVTGEVWSKVSNLVDEHSEFLTYSGSVVAGVRGTTYDFSVGNDGVQVQTIEHAVMVAERDASTQVMSKPTLVVSGKKAWVAKEGLTADMKTMKIQDMSPDEWKQRWVEDNQQKDSADETAMRQKTMERIREHAGPLPGDPGYDEKNRLIQRRLDATTDPGKRAELEASVAGLRMREAMVMVSMGKGAEEPVRQAMEMTGKEQKSDVFSKKLQLQMKMLDHSMEGVLPDQAGLYQLRESMRNTEVKLEKTPAARQRLEEKFTERKLYEISDLSQKPGVSKDLIDRQLKDYQKQADRVMDSPQASPDMRQINREFMPKFKNSGADPGVSKEGQGQAEPNQVQERKAPQRFREKAPEQKDFSQKDKPVFSPGKEPRKTPGTTSDSPSGLKNGKQKRDPVPRKDETIPGKGDRVLPPLTKDDSPSAPLQAPPVFKAPEAPPEQAPVLPPVQTPPPSVLPNLNFKSLFQAPPSPAPLPSGGGFTNFK